jgi:hypothetical protein
MRKHMAVGLLASLPLIGCLPSEVNNGIEFYRTEENGRAKLTYIDRRVTPNVEFVDFDYGDKSNLDARCVEEEYRGGKVKRCTFILDSEPECDCSITIPKGSKIVLRFSRESAPLQEEYDAVVAEHNRKVAEKK